MTLSFWREQGNGERFISPHNRRLEAEKGELEELIHSTYSCRSRWRDFPQKVSLGLGTNVKNTMQDLSTPASELSKLLCFLSPCTQWIFTQSRLAERGLLDHSQ